MRMISRPNIFAKRSHIMAKSLWMCLLLLILAVPSAYAAEPGGGEEEPPAEDAEPAVEEEPMTQAELAAVIIRMLGLASEVDENIGTDKLSFRSDNSELAYTHACTVRGICPLGGWKPKEKVTLEVVAVVVTQALGLLDKVENPDRWEDYAAVLEAFDLELTSVRDVLSEIEVVNPVVIILRGTSMSYGNNLSPVRGR